LSSIRGKYIIPFVISFGLVGKAGTPASSSGLVKPSLTKIEKKIPASSSGGD
jgi:hypothetical protein